MEDEYRNTDMRIRAVGREQARQLVEMMQTAFPDATFSFEQTLDTTEGTVSDVLAGTGTHTGDVAGRSASGAKARIVIVANPAAPQPSTE
jgi:SnoaL-like polyketide cyclase